MWKKEVNPAYKHKWRLISLFHTQAVIKHTTMPHMTFHFVCLSMRQVLIMLDSATLEAVISYIT